MFGRISLWAAGAVLAGLMLPSQAMAQYDAHVSTDLNLRVGPGTDYGVIDVIPGGYPVDVLGCLDAYEWCDIEWDGLRGWVSARYLVQPDTNVYLPDYGPRIGVPIISFSFGTYHDRYYRDRPWHRERHGRWTDWRDDDRDRDRRRGDRDGDRDRDRADDRDRDREQAERREERREAERAERREERREAERPQRQQREARPEQRQQREARPEQRQQREARPEQRQQREARPQQRQQREARPRQGERTQRQGQRQLPSSGGSEGLQLERGQ